MGLIAPISSNLLLEIVSNEKLFTDMLDVSGAGTAGGLTLSSVDKRMRELILKHSFFQRRVLARALTARAFRLSGASICAPLKIGEATRESFDTAARFALKFHRDRYQPLILEAQTAQRAFDDIVGRFFHALSAVDKSLVPPILKHITALKKPTPYIHIAHAIAKRSDPTATQDASNWLQYEESYLEECVEIACAQALKSDLNALQDAVTFFGLEDIQHEDLYEARLDVDIRKVINEYETSKAEGKEVKPLIQSAQNLLKVYDSRPCKIFIELGRCQLREDVPNCVENTLAILNLDKNHKAYYLSEIIDKSYRLKKIFMKHAASNPEALSSFVCIPDNGYKFCIERQLSNAPLDLAEFESYILSRPTSRTFAFAPILDCLIQNEDFLFAFQLLIKIPVVVDMYTPSFSIKPDYIDQTLHSIALKVAQSIKPGALRYALILANTIQNDTQYAITLFALANNSGFKDIPLLPLQGSIIQAIAHLANEWPHRKSHKELTSHEASMIENYLLPEPEPHTPPQLLVARQEHDRKAIVSRRADLKRKAEENLKQIDDESALRKRAVLQTLESELHNNAN